ncbi:Basic proline-rich protein precursor [[Actinomadura] parvosata subsp. kistnae]|nr:Basic proline-rich protein precursor [Actinomadura parvosata subsp. kistnae]
MRRPASTTRAGPATAPRSRTGHPGRASLARRKRARGHGRLPRTPGAAGERLRVRRPASRPSAPLTRRRRHSTPLASRRPRSSHAGQAPHAPRGVAARQHDTRRRRPSAPLTSRPPRARLSRTPEAGTRARASLAHAGSGRRAPLPCAGHRSGSAGAPQRAVHGQAGPQRPSRVAGGATAALSCGGRRGVPLRGLARAAWHGARPQPRARAPQSRTARTPSGCGP